LISRILKKISMYEAMTKSCCEEKTMVGTFGTGRTFRVLSVWNPGGPPGTCEPRKKKLTKAMSVSLNSTKP
jgi:hypothetical protein